LPVDRYDDLVPKNCAQLRRKIRAGNESAFVYVTTNSVDGGSAATSFATTAPGSLQLSSSSWRITTCGTFWSNAANGRMSLSTASLANASSWISGTASPMSRPRVANSGR